MNLMSKSYVMMLKLRKGNAIEAIGQASTEQQSQNKHHDHQDIINDQWFNKFKLNLSHRDIKANEDQWK